MVNLLGYPGLEIVIFGVYMRHLGSTKVNKPTFILGKYARRLAYLETLDHLETLKKGSVRPTGIDTSIMNTKLVPISEFPAVHALAGLKGEGSLSHPKNAIQRTDEGGQ